jgi:hypothetical protein
MRNTWILFSPQRRVGRKNGLLNCEPDSAGIAMKDRDVLSGLVQREEPRTDCNGIQEANRTAGLYVVITGEPAVNFPSRREPQWFVTVLHGMIAQMHDDQL